MMPNQKICLAIKFHVQAVFAKRVFYQQNALLAPPGCRVPCWTRPYHHSLDACTGPKVPVATKEMLPFSQRPVAGSKSCGSPVCLKLNFHTPRAIFCRKFISSQSRFRNQTVTPAVDYQVRTDRLDARYRHIDLSTRRHFSARMLAYVIRQIQRAKSRCDQRNHVVISFDRIRSERPVPQLAGFEDCGSNCGVWCSTGLTRPRWS